ncbi:uncharacterized protein Z519_07386 [Cladophialophora bantiana CBS 173.52]|uniref:Uncharacterized protein n=1 Tax=Cladophialophora bantiana (strain ATCC 10958 / CBS 173.52 / CDC B-1940 / NIH 8579) TaxID=1442370 RepID=A0A0D2G0Y6_CLAB1|nr:uncharacterized protein Z519_07386 [Cladophialophora bantiana CBS 173.52]KIW92402.1 hypothetical protein Z519_07386 [Cladophialophora bantiana CBS 173.52]
MPAFDGTSISPFDTDNAWSQSALDVAPRGRLDQSIEFPTPDQNLDPFFAPEPGTESPSSGLRDGYRNIQQNNVPGSSSTVIADQDSFSYFLEKVEFPFISPFDGGNWTLTKRYMAKLSLRSTAVTTAISAVEALYEAEEHGQETTNAIALYYLAKAELARMLRLPLPDLELTFVAISLLSCFEAVSQEDTVPITMKGEGPFIIKLERWIQERPWPPLVCRIEAWLKLLHVRALHLGGGGFLSAKVSHLLSHETVPVPSLIFLDQEPPPSSILYDSLTSPLFEFYIQTQQIGTAICSMNRHHRSRGTLTDENEVDHTASRIRKQLLLLHQQAPSLLRLSREELQSVVPESLLDQLSMLIDLCNAAYQIEIVDLGRAHGKWLTPTREAQEAMQQVRRIVDENVSRNNDTVNPGFIWPIFFYALEADREGGTWAVQMLQRVRKPTYHTDFMARFLDGVLELQRRIVERVDCRYFCTQKFGIAPPYI